MKTFHCSPKKVKSVEATEKAQYSHKHQPIKSALCDDLYSVLMQLNSPYNCSHIHNFLFLL